MPEYDWHPSHVLGVLGCNACGCGGRHHAAAERCIAAPKPPQPSLTPADLIALRDECKKSAGMKVRDEFDRGWSSAMDTIARRLDALITRLSSTKNEDQA